MTTSHNSQSRRPRKSPKFHGRYENAGRVCDAPGCCEEGEFRAPNDGYRRGAPRHDGPGRWRWLCLDHVRAFNAGYNFFAGMDTDEIYDAQRPTAGWESESRTFAGGGDPKPRWSNFSDPLDAIGARFRDNLRERSQAGMAEQTLGKADRQALSTLGLGADATRRTIRKAYSELVRRYHPDRNGGNRAHEKALQDVIAAYTHLKTSAAFE